ncbi:MAG: sugar phosphate isomerase/epimerase, partial [Clostridia bacterium]|nr:sugar phosphate isomerase/epimerase [Clostridia bacterium]
KAAYDKLKEYGITVYFHNHHREFIKMADGLTMYDHILRDAPDVNLTMDTFWLQCGGVSIIDYLERAKGRLECVHLKDYLPHFDENGQFTALISPVGDGNLNWGEIIPKMQEVGVKYMIVEQDNAVNYPDPFGQVERSIKYLKKNF